MFDGGYSGTMPSSRRGFLAGATALAATLAGCNDETARSQRETVTPVEVPRTDEEVLREAAALDVPSLHAPVVVSEAHHAAAVEQVEANRDALVGRCQETDTPVDFEDVLGATDTPDAVLDEVDRRLEAARNTGPSPEALEVLRRALRQVATANGYLLAETGDADVERYREAVESEEAAADPLREAFDYRVAEPGEYLPTLYAAEQALDRLEDASETEVRPGRADGEPDSRLVATLNYRLELARRRRDDVERYLATATDPEGPPLRGPIGEELDAVRAELSAVADRYGADSGDRPDGQTVADDLRGIRWSVGRRCERYLSSEPDAPPAGARVRVLLDGVDRLLEFESIDAAVERTVDRLGSREFPADRLLEEKRRAVDGLERAASAPALHRRLADTPARIVASADRFHRREDDMDVERLARTHLYYAGAAEWVERGLARADGLATVMQAQQS
jgi:hypothetical protein